MRMKSWPLLSISTETVLWLRYCKSNMGSVGTDSPWLHDQECQVFFKISNKRLTWCLGIWCGTPLYMSHKHSRQMVYLLSCLQWCSRVKECLCNKGYNKQRYSNVSRQTDSTWTELSCLMSLHSLFFWSVLLWLLSLSWNLPCRIIGLIWNNLLPLWFNRALRQGRDFEKQLALLGTHTLAPLKNVLLNVLKNSDGKSHERQEVWAQEFTDFSLTDVLILACETSEKRRLSWWKTEEYRGLSWGLQPLITHV